jgi:hypothetical protein
MAGFDNSFDREDIDFRPQPTTREEIRFEVERDAAWKEDDRVRVRFEREAIDRPPIREDVDRPDAPRPRTPGSSEVEITDEGAGAIGTVDSRPTTSAMLSIFKFFRTDIRNNNWF